MLDYTIISRKNIPENIYLCKPANDDWKIIYKFSFDNDLDYYIGSNMPIDDTNVVISLVREDYYLFTNFNSPVKILRYFHNEFNEFIDYDDCQKIWNYYNNNKQLIEQVIAQQMETE